MSETKKCIRCASDIPVAATYCKECESYQNWRRHLNFSSTFLALVIAVISVLTTFYNVAADRIWPPQSDVEYRLFRSDAFRSGTVIKNAMNKGELDGFVTEATLSTLDPEIDSLPFSITIQLVEDSVTIKPGLNQFAVVVSFQGNPMGPITHLAERFDIPEDSVQRALEANEAGLLTTR